MFLKTEDLVSLSGYKNKRCQRRWLSRNNIRYLVSADGRTIVLEEHVKQLLGANSSETKVRRSMPNFKEIS